MLLILLYECAVYIFMKCFHFALSGALWCTVTASEANKCFEYFSICINIISMSRFCQIIKPKSINTRDCVYRACRLRNSSAYELNCCWPVRYPL